MHSREISQITFHNSGMKCTYSPISGISLPTILDKNFSLLKFLNIFNPELTIFPFFFSFFSFFFVYLVSNSRQFFVLNSRQFFWSRTQDKIFWSLNSRRSLLFLVLNSRQFFWSRIRDVPCFFDLELKLLIFLFLSFFPFFKQLILLRTLFPQYLFVLSVHFLI